MRLDPCRLFGSVNGEPVEEPAGSVVGGPEAPVTGGTEQDAVEGFVAVGTVVSVQDVVRFQAIRAPANRAPASGVDGGSPGHGRGFGVLCVASAQRWSATAT